MICGCLEKDNGNDNACLSIIHPEGVVEKIDTYATIGSGAAYAELLLKNYYVSDILMELAIPVIIHTIDEVKDIDPNCGGQTRITTISAGSKIVELSSKDISEISQKTEALLELVEKNLIPKILRREIGDAEIRDFLQPKDS